MGLFEDLASKIKGTDKRIVFPEAHDERVLKAVIRLKEDKLLVPVLVGDPQAIQSKADEVGVSIEGIELYNPETYDAFDEMVAKFVERRKGKATEEQAREILKNNMYFSTMLVYQDIAEGVVAGATQSTGDTVRPALQIIKTKPGVALTSGVMVLESKSGEKLVFADCGINISPDAPQLAEIAVETAKTARIFDVDPKVAMLSFSTKGSAKSPEVEKMVEATKLAKELAPDLVLDGELQFDAAYVPEVGEFKAPGSEVAGHANVFIFPDVEAGNIGYKIAQRLGGYEAVGPILQSMAKPVSDLSRGCVEDDVYNLAIITANQALMED